MISLKDYYLRKGGQVQYWLHFNNNINIDKLTNDPDIDQILLANGKIYLWMKEK